MRNLKKKAEVDLPIHPPGNPPYQKPPWLGHRKHWWRRCWLLPIQPFLLDKCSEQALVGRLGSLRHRKPLKLDETGLISKHKVIVSHRVSSFFPHCFHRFAEQMSRSRLWLWHVRLLLSNSHPGQRWKAPRRDPVSSVESRADHAGRFDIDEARAFFDTCTILHHLAPSCTILHHLAPSCNISKFMFHAFRAELASELFCGGMPWIWMQLRNLARCNLGVGSSLNNPMWIASSPCDSHKI